MNLKFRIWSKEKGVFLETMDSGGMVFTTNGYEWHGLNMFLGSHFVIQQFTGLKDKNGREIYEGDIVKGINLYNFTGEFKGIINYFPCRFIYSVKYPNNGNGGGVLDATEVEEHCLEIVGNIFENPSLIS